MTQFFYGFDADDASTRYDLFGFDADDASTRYDLWGFDADASSTRYDLFGFDAEFYNSLIIRLRDKGGNIIPGVEIKLDDGVEVQSQQTDNDGDVAFTVALEQAYTLTIEHRGFKIYRHKFSLQTDGEWDLSIDPIVTVISKGKGFGINLNPNDPENEIFT